VRVPSREDRVSERARRALSLAESEARRLQHPQVEPEHLLLGLLEEGENVAVRVLEAAGLEPGDLRAAVEHAVPRGSEVVDGDLPQSARTRKVLDLAAGEGKRLGHSYIGTEHLLLGLLREGGGIQQRPLTQAGVTLDSARAGTVAVLSQAPPTETGLKRFNVVLPDHLFREMQDLADRRHTSVVELMRRFCRLGLLVTRASETTGSAFIIRDGDRERELLLL